MTREQAEPQLRRPMHQTRPMLLKILLAAAAVAAVLGVVKDGRVLEEVGLVGSCSAVAAPARDSGDSQA